VGTLGSMSSCLVSRIVVAGALGYVVGSFVGVPALSWALALAGVAAVVVWSRRSGAIQACRLRQPGSGSRR